MGSEILITILSSLKSAELISVIVHDEIIELVTRLINYRELQGAPSSPSRHDGVFNQILK